MSLYGGTKLLTCHATPKMIHAIRGSENDKIVVKHDTTVLCVDRNADCINSVLSQPKRTITTQTSTVLKLLSNYISV